MTEKEKLIKEIKEKIVITKEEIKNKKIILDNLLKELESLLEE